MRVGKRQFGDGDAANIILQGRDKFKVETYLPILDRLSVNISYRL